MSETKKRIEWIDMAKGYAILLVIFSHSVAMLLNTGDPTAVAIVTGIHSFHMPLFFFLSGYVFSTRRPWGDFVKSRIRSIVVPYFCMCGILALATFAAKFLHHELTVMEIIRRIGAILVQNRLWVVWFLACLFLVELMAYWLVKKIKSHWALGILAAVLPVLGLLYFRLGGRTLPWDLDICFLAMPFFLAGYLCRQHSGVFVIAERSRGTKAAAFLLLGAVNVGCTWLSYRLTGQRLDFYDMSFGFLPLSILAAFAGIGFCILLARQKTFRFIRYLGEYTMFYFAINAAIAIPFVDLFLPYSLFAGIIPSSVIAIPVWAFVQLIVVTALLTIGNELILRLGLGFMLGKSGKK